MTVAAREAPHAPTTVVHLITTLGQGGAERVLSQVVPRPQAVPVDASGAPRERHVVVSLVAGGLFADELVAAGVEVRSLGMRPGRDVARGVWRLAALLRTLRPTLVVGWMYHACLLLLLARPLAGPGRRTRTVWNLRGSLHAIGTLGASTRLVIGLLARTSGVPEAIAINSEVGRQHHEQYGFRPRRWNHLPNGCDVDRFRPDESVRARIRRELGVDDRTVVLTFIGRVHPVKGTDLLMTAAAQLDVQEPTALILVGKGTMELAEETPEGRTRTLGLGVRDDVADLLRGADLLVLPSRSEGTPNAVIEAMATGVPCVVTDVGDCADLVGPSGRVVPAGSAEHLSDAIATLIRVGPEERRRLGTEARGRVLSRHAPEVARTAYRRLWDTAT